MGNGGDGLIMKVRATLEQRGGGMSGTLIGSHSEWRQVDMTECNVKKYSLM